MMIAQTATSLPWPYVFVKVLGKGASGYVYLVDNKHAMRREAMKVLKSIGTRSLDDLARRRFEREVAVTQRLAHPNIVTTFASGELADERRYLTMEYVEGATLFDLVQQRGPLSIGQTLGVLAEAADAVHHAHELGILHRDLKPHNLMLASHPYGSIVRILDFGMAGVFGPAATGPMLTARGTVFGTPAYMSPEQSRGASVDTRTDIYALGCIGFELLVGTPPFRGGLAELFAAHVMKRPAPPSQADPAANISREVDALILRCLAKRPEDRFQSCADLCAAIQTIEGYRPLRRLS